MNPLISIIVPVYQVEKYLDKCIISIINQSYKNLEIILVDDGSTDSSPAICNQYQKKDTRIKVIHKENGGLSQARNVGLEIAQGDYIGFVDSDDWIESNMYEVLMSSLLETGADIAVCNYQMDASGSKALKKIYNIEKKVYSPEEALRKIITADGYIRTVVWNKLYKRSVWGDIKFPEGRIYEDTLWTAKVVGNSKSISYINYSLYHYLFRPDSLSNNENQITKRVSDKIEMSEQRIMYLHEYYPMLEKIAILKFQEFCYEESIVISIKYNHLNNADELIRELHRHFCQSGPINTQDVRSIKMKIGRLMFKMFPKLFTRIYMIIYPRIQTIKLSLGYSR